MPLLSILRFFAILISLVVLGTAIYLLWSWYQGDALIESDGDVVQIREDWRLWTGLALLAWSVLGKFIVPFLLARSDDRKTYPRRSNGRSISGASGSLYVEEHGASAAPTLIMVHGWSLDSTIWQYAKADLGQRFRLITWDLPGMGKSKPASRDRIELSVFADELRRLVMAKAEEKVVLVGHSIGGMTIQTLAKEHPEMFGREIAGVVLVNTTYTSPLKTIIFSSLMQALQKPLLEPAMRLTIILNPLAWLAAWQSYFSGWTHIANRFGFGKYVTRSQLEHVTLLTTRNSPENMAKGNLAMFSWDATGAIAATNVPALVIGGTADIVTKPEASKELAGSGVKARLSIIDGVNHMGFLERADLYNTAIASFAEEVFHGASPTSRPTEH